MSLFFCALIPTMPQLAFAQDGTQVITDQEHSRVIIVIDGEPAVMIDKEGLHVVENISYGGRIADLGSDSIQESIKEINTTSNESE